MSKSDHIGKTVLVGITECDEDGKALSFTDMFGTIVSAHETEGILLKLSNGQDYNLPPFELDDYSAKHDFYEMKSDQKVVEPDFVITFDIIPPRKH